MKPCTRVKTPNGSGVITGTEGVIYGRLSLVKYLVELDRPWLTMKTVAFWPHEIERE